MHWFSSPQNWEVRGANHTLIQQRSKINRNRKGGSAAPQIFPVLMEFFADLDYRTEVSSASSTAWLDRSASLGTSIAKLEGT